MHLPTVALSCAVATSLVAAVTDGRFGIIPNSLTLPPLLLAPVAYGVFGGGRALVASFATACLCSAVPYLLFRARAMGGGDVKLFAALGALTAYDPLAGLQIQLTAFIVAMVGTVSARVLRLGEPGRPTVDSKLRDTGSVRLGGFILVATLLQGAMPLAAGVRS